MVVCSIFRLKDEDICGGGNRQCPREEDINVRCGNETDIYISFKIVISLNSAVYENDIARITLEFDSIVTLCEKSLRDGGFNDSVVPISGCSVDKDYFEQVEPEVICRTGRFLRPNNKCSE